MPLSVLMLDSEQIFQTSVARKLRLHGMLVHARSDFDGLDSLLGSFSFDVVILDAALLRAGLAPLRRMADAGLAPAVILTAAPEDAALVRQARELGFRECLLKPIHPDILLRSVETRADERSRPA